MSHISVQGEQSTEDEITALSNLAALPNSAAGEFIQKTGPTTFANGTGSGGSAAGSTGSIQINQLGVLSSDTKAIWNFTTHAMNANIDMGTFT